MDPWDPSPDQASRPPQPIRVATSPLAPLPRSSPNRSSPHATISTKSSQSSLYLSPPLTDSESEEVPYKPSADDRISLDMHNTRKRFTKPRHRQNPQPLAIMSRERPSNQLWPIKELYQSRPQKKSKNSGDSPSNKGNSYQIKTIRSTIQKLAKTQERISARSKDSSRNATHESRSPRQRGSTMGKVQSWRSNDVQRLVEGSKKRRRWTLIGDSLPPSTSFATVAARRPSEDKVALITHMQPTGAGRPLTPTRKESTRRNRAFRDGSRRRESSQGEKCDTPATITLRKASKIGKAPDGIALRAQLGQITTQSTLISGDSDTIEAGDRHWPRQVVSAISSTSVISDETSSPRNSTLATFIGELHDRASYRRPTVTAEPALTFAEVHTSPKVFPSAGASSRKHSLIPIDTMRRSSVVQIRSGSSIHEIIWDKDDTPSTRSSHSRDTLSPDMLSTTTRNDSDDEVTAINPFQQGPQSGNHDESDYFQNPAATGSATDGLYPVERLIGWSWEMADAGINLNIQPGLAKLEEPIPAPVSVRLNSKPSRKSKSWDASPVIGIESFPPLLDRHSTHEWRRAPLVDLNDPKAGREATGAEDEPSGQLVPNDAEDGAQSLKPIQAWPDNLSKSRKPSRVGEAIGISHGHRRPSTAPSQQRPYKSLIEVSKSVSGKASIIGHCFSELATSSMAGVSGSPRAPIQDPVGVLPPGPVIWGAEGLSVVPQWRKNSSSGLRINTMVSPPMPRLIEVAGSHSGELE
jgi:hypothetical protein